MNDVEIAQKVKLVKIDTIAKKLNIKDYSKYGEYKAKISCNEEKKNKKAKLILVTATSPTPFGEGKTTVSIGLLDSLCYLKKKACAALREPSMGPVFGLKGGATGGGYAQMLPMEDINLHFNGDFHAITSANNLISAAIDNHLYNGNSLKIDKDNILFNRCLDVNDRALKNIVIQNKKYERIEKFDITAASEMMAIFCLAKSLDDLRNKIDNILIAYDIDGKPVFLRSLNITGSLMVILKDAIKPNLVQTIYHNPILVHGGPFANIAHGCNSIMATNKALSMCDYVVTEAGFGSDLGALKFYDIKCRELERKPDVTILVTTIKALKYNGNGKLEDGILNLEAHLNIINHLTKNIIVCLNKYDNDELGDIEYVKQFCKSKDVSFSIVTSYKDGYKGAIDLANKVIEFNDRDDINELYSLSDSIKEKISKIVKDIYGAKTINYSKEALRKIDYLEKNKLDNKPICIAKTQYSISDDKNKLGYPKDFEVTIKDIKVYNGAGFITVYLGNIITMPGLPLVPNYEKIDLIDNNIKGLF